MEPSSRRPSRASDPRRRTGGRSARVVRAVLDATIEALSRGGYAGLSIEDVAARAGVSRTTVYRRWPTRPDLVRAALLSMADDQPPAPDSGSLRDDLLEVSRRKLAAFCDRGGIGLARTLMAEGAHPELAVVARVVRARHMEPIFAVIERAIARGELPRDTDPHLVVDPLMATIHMRLCIDQERPSDAYVARLVDLMLAGARAGAASR